MTQPNNYPSPSAEQFAEGGGNLYDQCWVRVNSARTEMNTTYRKDGKPTPMIICETTLLESGEATTEMFPLGSADNWTTDGKWVFATPAYEAQVKQRGQTPQLSKINKGVQMLANIQESGFKWDDATFPQTGVNQLAGHLFWLERYELQDKRGNPIPQMKKDPTTGKMVDSGFNKTTITYTKWGGNGQQPIEQGAAQATTTQAPTGPDPNDSAALET